MSRILLVVACAAITAVAMEGWAAVLHRSGWHGWLWWAHKSHHRGRRDVAAGAHPRASGLELNDIFGPMHAAVATPLMMAGIHFWQAGWAPYVLGISVGMTLFGVAYVLVHDGLCHRRLPVGFLLRWRYLARVAAAHAVHHRTGQAPFGLFLGPWVLRRAARARRMARAQNHAAVRLDFGARLQ